MYQKKFLWIINRVKIGFQEQNFLVETTKEIKGNEIEYENKKKYIQSNDKKGFS